MGNILVGISSWAEPAFIETGSFYPPGIKTPAERMSYYSAQFPLTELDSVFYVLPPRRSLDLWLNNTPANFRFNVKAFRMLTGHPTPFNSLPRIIKEKMDSPKSGNLYSHHLTVELMTELWQVFNSAIEPLRSNNKLGVVFFQFPPWFHFGQANFNYISACKEKLSDYPMAVEFRTPDWLIEEHLEATIKYLKENDISLVCVDEPQGLKTSVPTLAGVTGATGIIRFHGRNQENWEKDEMMTERFAYLYNEKEIEEWIPKIEKMAEQAKQVHVIFKNKHLDYPYRNATQMLDLLNKKAARGKVIVPRATK